MLLLSEEVLKKAWSLMRGVWSQEFSLTWFRRDSGPGSSSSQYSIVVGSNLFISQAFEKESPRKCHVLFLQEIFKINQMYPGNDWSACVIQ
jgi:hypothetical protein